MNEPKALYQLLEEWRAREDRPKHKQPDGDVTYGICAGELETALRAWDAALGQDVEGKPDELLRAERYVAGAVLGVKP